MAQQLTEVLKFFLENYIQGKEIPFGKNAAVYTSICGKAPSKIYETGLVDSAKYKVEGSVGQGNWAKVPWLAIFRKEITQSAQNGVYIVYLLSSDGNSLYLTFNQGVTEAGKNSATSDTIKALRNNAARISTQLSKRSFLSDENINLGNEITDLGKKYQKGTIFYKKYSKNNIPPEDSLQQDLRDMLEIYEEYYEKIYKKNHNTNLKTTIISNTGNATMQKIFFGAPGTGKSYKINSILAEQRKNAFASSDISKSNHYAEVLSDKNYIDCNIWMIDNLSILEKKLASYEADDKVSNPRHSALKAYIDFLKKYENEQRENRTTFHPDYDYAQFIGTYKPKKAQYGDDGSLSEEELSQKLSDAFTDNGNGEIDKTTAITLFGLQYANSLNGKTISQIVKNSGIGDEQYKKANLSAAVKARLQFLDIEEKITYSFVPQVFAKAYAAAWNQYFKSDNASTTGNQVYLVIEEINRGNCAQIFGDIFQLLDRDSEGFSQYAIDADCDFADWLENDEAGLKSFWDKYKNEVGEGKLKLPPNLNILATMNTSDQSLFPMDSAFKRRFDWEYVPISFDGKDAANYQIEVEGSANPYSWKDFVETVNEKILKITESEDKQLGEYFIKPDKKNENGEYVVISCERFLGKVMFYLWNEVCKDEHKNGSFFRVKIDGKEEYFTFQDLYKKQGLLKQFMDELLKKE